MSPRATSKPYHGPHVVLSTTEVARVLDALHGHHDTTAVAIRRKCTAALHADPKFRQPAQ